MALNRASPILFGVAFLWMSPSSYALQKKIQCLQTHWKTRRSSIRWRSSPRGSLHKSCFSAQTVLKSAPLLPQNNYGFQTRQPESALVCTVPCQRTEVAMHYHENGREREADSASVCTVRQRTHGGGYSCGDALP